jgi:hypothetical protein
LKASRRWTEVSLRIAVGPLSVAVQGGGRGGGKSVRVSVRPELRFASDHHPTGPADNAWPGVVRDAVFQGAVRPVQVIVGGTIALKLVHRTAAQTRCCGRAGGVVLSAAHDWRVIRLMSMSGAFPDRASAGAAARRLSLPLAQLFLLSLGRRAKLRGVREVLRLGLPRDL